jgi:hypothetical protein
MRRREFIAGLGAAGWPLLVRAQQRTKPTIGWLDVRPGGPTPEYVEGFRRGLAEVGFSEGRDVTVEYRTADGHFELELPTAALIWYAKGWRRHRNRPTAWLPKRRRGRFLIIWSGLWRGAWLGGEL